MGLEDASKVAPAPAFAVPVDSEHKAKRIRIFSFAQPHMRAFHLAWFAFFMTFFATFGPAALLTTIRDNIGADKWQLGSAGVAAVCGAVFCRVFLGGLLDTLGARIGTACTVLLFSPAVFCMALVTNPGSFIVVRFFIGCSLCMFVCCQFWVTMMFNVRIVGTANAVAAGWGNAGGGACLLLMPLIAKGIERSVPAFEAWRWAFFVPGGIYLLIGIVVLLMGQDGPDGDYRTMRARGQLPKTGGSIWPAMRVGLTNYRTWILAATYGFSFGVELTVDNIIHTYLHDQFELNDVVAGALGSIFGLMNIFSRGTGGIISDLVATRYGMRGRLWVLWTIQMLGGVFCLAMGYVDYSLGATIAVMVVFSIFCQQACGAHYGVAPFISRRAYGIVSGTIGAGGNIGAMITQMIFFAGARTSPVLTTQEGLRWMGVMTLGVTMLLVFVGWPMWGSMFKKGDPDFTEEDYYLREWTAEEVAQGLHGNSMKFAMESRSQRGSISIKAHPPANGTSLTTHDPSASGSGAKAVLNVDGK